MNDGIITANEMLTLVCDNLEKAELEKNNKLLKSWRFVVSSIKSNALNGKNLGTNLYAHSRVIDLKNGILLVECDHPGWIQTFRLYQKYILTGLNRGVPEAKISSLAFRLKGANFELHNHISEEKLKSELQQKLDKEDEILREFQKSQTESQKTENPSQKEIPENLQKILDKLKNDILEENSKS